MLFNNGGELFFLVLFVKFYFGMETNELRYGLWLAVVANSRKRGREVFGNTNTGGVVAPTVNSFPLQPQPSQLIDLSVLHNHQPNVVSTGLRLAFGEQHLQHPQQQQQQQQNQQQQSAVLSLLSEDFTAQIKHQRDEIDQFLRAQVPILFQFKWVRFNFHFYGAHLQCESGIVLFFFL